MYVVSFISHNSQNELFELKDTYYIDDQTFAIKKFTSREYGRNGEYRSPRWNLDSLHSYQARAVESVCEFDDYKGKMYLKYFTEPGEYDVFNSKTKSVEYNIEGITMLVVTNIKETGDKTIVNTMDLDERLSQQTPSYNASSWSNYDR